MKLDKAYWDEKYKEHQTGWDLGLASPPLVDFINQLDNLELRILIPGCGNAYEAQYLLHKGFKHITLIDLSETLVSRLKSKWEGIPEIEIIHGDFFELAAEYDLIIEQTFFCALDPQLRESYIQKMKSLLRKNGSLIGLLFNRVFEKEGPPFGGSHTEYKSLFQNYFTILTLEPCYNSIAPRLGSELFFHLKNTE